MTVIQADSKGRYGKFGGCYVPELLVEALMQLEQAFLKYKSDKNFLNKYHYILKNYAGRATPLTYAQRLTEVLNGPIILLKREDLLHTGAHKLNNALGQCLLAKKIGKKRIIAETGAGQHGVATAAACAYLGLECVVYMGSLDMKRQEPNVTRMKLLGAKVKSVEGNSNTLCDAINEALRDWSHHFDNSHYCIGSALGPHPYPEMVAFFQSVIGQEVEQQCFETYQRDPNCIIACVGGGSNAIGIFSSFINKSDVKLIGVEAGGRGNRLGHHAARFLHGRPGVLHGCYSYVLQCANGQIVDTHSVSAGLDYPSVSPQHAYLYESGRVKYGVAYDDDAVFAMRLLSQTEGIMPALESAHALAYLIQHLKDFSDDDLVVVNISGRGDKDLPQLMAEGLI